MQIKVLADGGSMAPGPALSQKLGPLGINMGQVIQKVNDATKNFKGMKVPVEIDVNPTTKNVEIKVFSPPTSELLKKEIGSEKGSGAQNKIKVGNLSIEQVIGVAMTKHGNMLSKDLKSAVKNVVGTCVSLGILIENKHPNEIQKEIESGKYDKEIKSEKTETSKEKKDELEKYFQKIKEDQEKTLKAEQAAKEAEKAAADAAAAVPGAAAVAPATTEKAKAPEKK